MEKEMIITYSWWDSDEKEIPEKYKEELQELAIDRIKYLLSEGYVEGQLCAEIEDTVFNGFVTIKTTTLY